LLITVNPQCSWIQSTVNYPFILVIKNPWQILALFFQEQAKTDLLGANLASHPTLNFKVAQLQQSWLKCWLERSLQQLSGSSVVNAVIPKGLGIYSSVVQNLPSMHKPWVWPPAP
jgi:hypothetical protein